MAFILKPKPEFIKPKRIYREDSPVMNDLGAGVGKPVILTRFADLSDDLVYRWELGRIWDAALPVMCWVMLNPSKADSEVDDPTIRVCCGRARFMGFGGIVVVNLFAYRSTDPRVLWDFYNNGQGTPVDRLEHLVGGENDRFIIKHITESAYVMVAWGNGGDLAGRDRAVARMLKEHSTEVWCLGLTKTNQPKHPVRLGYNVTPARYL